MHKDNRVPLYYVQAYHDNGYSNAVSNLEQTYRLSIEILIDRVITVRYCI